MCLLFFIQSSLAVQRVLHAQYLRAFLVQAKPTEVLLNSRARNIHLLWRQKHDYDDWCLDNNDQIAFRILKINWEPYRWSCGFVFWVRQFSLSVQNVSKDVPSYI